MSDAIKDALKLGKENNVEFVDLKFIDMMGTWHHITIPSDFLNEDLFEDGLGFDGSSIRGWRTIDSSDMLFVPDATTARIDPFYDRPTLSIICNIEDPITRERYDRDPRNIARNAVEYLKSTGLADTVYFGPEAEFFVFDDVRYESSINCQSYRVDSSEGSWNTNREEEGGNLANKIRGKEGYIPVPPGDAMADIRMEMMSVMKQVGLVVEAGHHEVATGGQFEIDLKFEKMISMSDDLMWYKYIVKNVAREYGLSATFMPKPMAGDNGSGMHVHQSLWKDGVPLFAGDKYAGFSQMGLYYIGGIMKHASALVAFTNPTTNSYKRLVPGFEAPVNIAYSARNRSAAVRIPMYSPSPKAKRLECRFPDPTANPYMAFSAMLMAGLDGILNKIDPGEPMDKDIYSLSPEELEGIGKLPGSLAEGLEALRNDYEFLTKGGVFSEDFIFNWIDYKMSNDVAKLSLAPHPIEFQMYYDV